MWITEAVPGIVLSPVRQPLQEVESRHQANRLAFASGSNHDRLLISWLCSLKSCYSESLTFARA
jgi:hypothetical protein